MEGFSLETLERLVLRSLVLQRFVLRTHGRAFRELAGALPPVERVAIVGGGLFPRTALILKELLPTASMTIIDANRSNLDLARALVGHWDINFVNSSYMTSDCGAYDLLVIPLSFDGDRSAIYARPPFGKGVLLRSGRKVGCCHLSGLECSLTLRALMTGLGSA